MNMTITFPGGKKVNAQYEEYTIKTDQPATSGGEGSAPAPFDLFVASVGTCAGFYVQNFLSKRDIPVDKARILLRTEKDEETGLHTKFVLDIQLPPEFPEKYTQAVIRAADLCSVKKHIVNAPDFEINVRIDQ